MYKVVIKDKYVVENHRKQVVGEYNSIAELKDATIDYIRYKELLTALKFVCDTNHNVMEFGANGYFTVSYYDVEYDE